MPSMRFARPASASAEDDPTTTSAGTLSPSFALLLTSWERSLRAGNRSRETLASYLVSVRQLARFLVEKNMPQDVAGVRREHVEAFLADLGDRGRKPKTIYTRYAALLQFFKWLEEEGEISAPHPMLHVKPPQLDDTPPAMLSDDEIRALLKVCEGHTLDARRDTAIIRLLLDTGMRASALVGMRVADIDWRQQELTITTKGQQTLIVSFGAKSAEALDRYLRARAKHGHANEPALWLAKFGKLSYAGVYAILQQRAKEAGITRRIHPHMFRHTFADLWKSAGGGEDELMALGGWRDRTVMGRYGRANQAKRARAMHKEISPGDRF